MRGLLKTGTRECWLIAQGLASTSTLVVLLSPMPFQRLNVNFHHSTLTVKKYFQELPSVRLPENTAVLWCQGRLRFSTKMSRSFKVCLNNFAIWRATSHCRRTPRDSRLQDHFVLLSKPTSLKIEVNSPKRRPSCVEMCWCPRIYREFFCWASHHCRLSQLKFPLVL